MLFHAAPAWTHSSQFAATGFCIGRGPPNDSRTGHFQNLSGVKKCCATSGRSGRSGGEKSSSTFQTPLPIRDFYALLGVHVDASPGEIRQAYRKLQKKHHPDIVGMQGHAMTLLLNEAYQTLMDVKLRNAYNLAHSYSQNMMSARYTPFAGNLYSTWVGPDRPQGIFVDENICVGCRECVYVAPNTFVMDENTGCARVKAQWADPEPVVKVAREVCPVNCIHLVEREDLPALEYLIRPQPKASNGVYGGGWERPRNVFMAAATLKRQAKETTRTAANSTVGEETADQKRARMEADFKIRMGPFWKLWSWAGKSPPSAAKEGSSSTNYGKSENEWPWKGLFGRSSTSDVLILPVTEENIAKTVAVVQEWATTFASSSELPLPMPFRTDLLPNGVQLSLITATNGTVSSIGNLVVTVESTSVSESAALGMPYEGGAERQQGKESYFRIRREGTTGNGPLPGEGRIVKALKNVVLGRDRDYNVYRIPRR